MGGLGHVAAGVVLGLELGQAGVERRARESAPEPVEHPAGGLRVAIVGEAPEQVGVECAVFDRARGGERSGVVDRDRAEPVDDAGAEADGGVVALADLTDAHHEAQVPWPGTRLIGRRDGGRVAERGGLDGVFVGERRTEQ